MTQVLIVYGPDASCVDPEDHDSDGRRHVDVVPDGSDCIIIWRKPVGDLDADGHVDTHIFGMGTFENVTIDEAREALVAMGDLTGDA